VVPHRIARQRSQALSAPEAEQGCKNKALVGCPVWEFVREAEIILFHCAGSDAHKGIYWHIFYFFPVQRDSYVIL
jgi:hypothetical protein